ncbi:aminotransferase class V-fold PLP-dependent enzyme [Devosia sp. XJ19-1]|uniref:Aminotransferase class V-fold PLP-dependent enzyme n=1 Tax=Devosia ureilytica TaxID=2952754 RepID=A0A9Q4APA9_9HYPH|nr:aminotransferase class V-fold PLP-dependent enzyme [Devosia ureilytica]MCP8883851.1 aminotransferase class V-fold PLP-dependent enzyme [Devosia ureilytica]MCP8887459.1 aminotransferase class V-fold PLP-dependent enzyme [Devosia ureilytica]
MTNLPLDLARIRALFPAFAEPSLAGQAFFENGGGSYTAQTTLDRLDHYYRATKVQPYGVYPASEAAGQAMDNAYARLAQALNVSTDWIHIGPSSSANTYVLGNAFGAWLKPGDAIVVTNQDHEANTGNWRRLAARGIEVREWRVDPETACLSLATLNALLDEKVKLVTAPHCSNIVGDINPVAEIAARAHAVGAVVVIDGVSYAPHGLPDLTELGADIYFFSAYKTFGPHQGVMAIRPELASALPNQGHYFNDAKLRYRLTPAGPDHAQIAATAGVVDYLEQVAALAPPSIGGADPFRRAHTAMRAQEIALATPLLDYLRTRNDIRLIGPSDPARRAPTISVLHAEPGIALARRLASHGIMASGGNFYSVRLLEALGIDPYNHGVLRLSFVHYTSPEEIQQLIKALDAEL